MSDVIQRARTILGRETFGLLILMAVMVLGFSLASPKFLTGPSLSSMGFQAPLLGLLTLAMLAPMISGGFNLAIVYTANISGLALAWVMLQFGGPEAGLGAIALGVVAALVVGTLAGAVMGAVIAYIGAHPILVSLAMMIFLRGLGEFLTRGGDISGFPPALAVLGHGTFLGLPVPLILFGLVALVWHVMLRRSRHGFAVYMVGSNIRATEYSGIDTKRTLVMIYALSGTLCAVAGILMAARFNSVRVGHGEALLLVTVLAIFLGGIDPFGGHGKVAPVILSVLILQVLSSGLNLIGANQHLATAVWGLFLIAVMILRSEQLAAIFRRKD
ncbi:ABC transporter permease [Paracoccus lutimaris]|uniref:Monosaccharide ABC transporter membrane protein (CUT2 family) n=1 Tax=Paracoccus lutimaris TaxID=1490030 RepID=A0A368YLL9_9RHOB|nr:ABC transporter permease [Paracoccus lutimaris]RCW80489.1 monosaccharide ABC transporter membrane protein (CUT2 family) [Paracoccus lutimaris]